MADENDSFGQFGLFDREAEIDVRERYLPHWFQPGAATYVTFRLIDSMPSSVIERITREMAEWLKGKGWPTSFADIVFHHDPILKAEFECSLSNKDRQEFNTLSRQLVHISLDECHGSCLLSDQRCSTIVANSILHFNGIKYDLDRFVVMPNHVHAIVQFYDQAAMRAIGQSWMRYSARLINRLLGRKDCLWQAEPFDHIIRSAEQFWYIQDYIKANPTKAKLKFGDYLYWQR